MAKKDKKTSTDGKLDSTDKELDILSSEFEEKFEKWQKEDPDGYNEMQDMDKEALIRLVLHTQFEYYTLRDVFNEQADEFCDVMMEIIKLLEKARHIGAISPKLSPATKITTQTPDTVIMACFDDILSVLNNVLIKENNASKQIAGWQDKGAKKKKEIAANERAAVKEAIINHSDPGLKYRQKKDIASVLYYEDGWDKEHDSFEYFKGIVGKVMNELRTAGK